MRTMQPGGYWLLFATEDVLSDAQVLPADAPLVGHFRLVYIAELHSLASLGPKSARPNELHVLLSGEAEGRQSVADSEGAGSLPELRKERMSLDYETHTAVRVQNSKSCNGPCNEPSGSGKSLHLTSYRYKTVPFRHHCCARRSCARSKICCAAARPPCAQAAAAFSCSIEPGA